MAITLNTEHLRGYVEEKDIKKILPEVKRAHEALENRTGKGSEFTGWIDLPSRMRDKELDDLIGFGEEIRDHADCVLNIGIGGSYLGLRATAEFLISELKIPIHYAGHNLSAGYLYHLLNGLRDKRVVVVVVSKSGTTTEPALAFRIVKKFMEEKYNQAELKKRIICVTDEEAGALRRIAQMNGYKAFSIAHDVGGRFSVLTYAGLVPLAVAGIDIKALIEGAREAQRRYSHFDVTRNIAYHYAAARYLLYKQEKSLEVLATFYQRLAMVGEWWKQLFGESEGKDGKGIYPSSLSFTTDLHSMGQFLQEGLRMMFETFLMIEDSAHRVIIPSEKEDLDHFNCVAGKDLDYVNKQAYKATAMAHFEGGVPNMTITIPCVDAHSLGELYYFFQRAVAMTGYLLGVNPFNQPGVEAYKTKMFELLGMKKK